MKTFIFLIFFGNFLIAQVDSSFHNKRELFSGIFYELNFGSTFLGPNIGYSSRINESKNLYYRVDIQYSQRFYSSTHSSAPKDNFWYEDLNVNSLILNNMFSYRFYKKHKDRSYFDLGAFLSVNLWQQKKGNNFIGVYQSVPEDFKKTYIFLPGNVGIHFGWGIRASKKILLKPELRLGLWSFDKLFEDSKVLYEMRDNAIISANFSIAYLF